MLLPQEKIDWHYFYFYMLFITQNNMIDMKGFRFLALAALLMAAQATTAQITSVPQTAKDNFEKQYPGATNVDWDNDLVHVNVNFMYNGEEMNAEYNNKGIWRNTSKATTYDSLPEPVKDGFSKSKYADRTVSDTKIIYLPGDVIQYRIKAEKNDVEKKYLYFDEKGKLVRDVITI